MADCKRLPEVRLIQAGYQRKGQEENKQKENDQLPPSRAENAGGMDDEDPTVTTKVTGMGDGGGENRKNKKEKEGGGKEVGKHTVIIHPLGRVSTKLV